MYTEKLSKISTKLKNLELQKEILSRKIERLTEEKEHLQFLQSSGYRPKPKKKVVNSSSSEELSSSKEDSPERAMSYKEAEEKIDNYLRSTIK